MDDLEERISALEMEIDNINLLCAKDVNELIKSGKYNRKEAKLEKKTSEIMNKYAERVAIKVDELESLYDEHDGRL